MLALKVIISLCLALAFSLPVTIASEPDYALRLKNHVSVLAADSLEGRGLGTEGTVKARDYILNEFMEAGIEPLGEDYLQDFRFRMMTAWIPAANIAGIINGSDPRLRDEYIVIGAHYDHIGYNYSSGERVVFNGADDNASGVAAIIEVGRYFAQRPHLLGRSLIVVAFDAEESGLHGSTYFVENSIVPREDIRLMFSFDMVGMYDANNGLDLRGMASLKGGDELAHTVAQRSNLNLRRTGSQIAQRTDTAPFGKADIPAVHVFTGMKSPYHKPEDTYEKLDYEGMELINDFMKNIIADLSTQESLDPAQDLHTAASPKKLTAGLLLNIGSGFHRYPDTFYSANSVLNLSAGIYTQFALGNMLTLQPEVLYDYNGSKIEGGTFRRHALTVPVNMQLGTPRSLTEVFRAYVFAGPYYRHTFSAESSGVVLDLETDLDPQEWGYSLGVAIEIFRFSVGFTHRRAVTNMWQSDDLKMYDTNSYFTLGYKF